jgi:probable HAF family extracellular repeat protein
MADLAQDAFLYFDGAMTDLGTLGGTQSFAYSVNASGQIVGYSTTKGNATFAAFLYSGGTMTDLNSLLPPDSGWTLYFAEAINNQGQIVGTGTNPNGQHDAFLLTPTPVPEPKGIGVFAVLGSGILLRRRRRRPAG